MLKQERRKKEMVVLRNIYRLFVLPRLHGIRSML